LPGEMAEDRACQLLKSEGYEIVARNWRCRSGEVDIVARDGTTLVFVEVKSRRSETFGGPEGAVHAAKQRRIVSAARAFLSATGCDLPVRFDVVTFIGARARLHRDAFQVGNPCSPN
jgi:putative endonuclease